MWLSCDLKCLRYTNYFTMYTDVIWQSFKISSNAVLIRTIGNVSKKRYYVFTKRNEIRNDYAYMCIITIYLVYAYYGEQMYKHDNDIRHCT